MPDHPASQAEAALVAAVSVAVHAEEASPAVAAMVAEDDADNGKLYRNMTF